jgi:acyl carrier protein
MKETIRRFLTTNFYIADPDQLNDDTSLLDSGIVDSTGVLEVIMFIEKEFGFKVAEEDMLPDNLDSIAKIAEYVGRVKAKEGAF